MSSFLGFDPNDPLANKPSNAPGNFDLQALGNIPADMWEGMNMWDKVSLGTGLAAPLAAPIPPLAAALGGISFGTGLLGAGQSVYEDPSAFNIGANLAGVTPWGKLANKMEIFHPPTTAQQKTDFEALEAAGKDRDQIWEETYETFGTPMYRDQTGQIKVFTPDNKFQPIAAPMTPAQMRADMFPDGMPGPDIQEGTYYHFDTNGNPVPRTHGAAYTTADGKTFMGTGDGADAAIDDLVMDRWMKEYGNKHLYFDDLKRQVGMTFNLGDIFEHPEFTKATGYDLNRHKVKLVDSASEPRMRESRGGLDPSTGEILINVDHIRDANEMRSTLIHELQHGAQEKWGMQPGYSYDRAKKHPAEINQLHDAGKAEMAANRSRQRDFYDQAGYNESRALRDTAFTLKEIDRLEGYLDDHWRHGSNLTNKRRNIFNSGQSIMDHNDEYEMRIRTVTTPKWKKPAERNGDYVEYIRNVIAAAERNLDPNLVEQVRNSGVKNPTAKYTRQMDKVRENYAAQYGAQEKQLADEVFSLAGFRYHTPAQIYGGTLGEAEARTTQELLDVMNLQLNGKPWNTETWREYGGQFFTQDAMRQINNIKGFEQGSQTRGLLSNP